MSGSLPGTGKFSIVEQSPGAFSLAGELTFETANNAIEKTSGLFNAAAKREAGAVNVITLDLSGIMRADSAGLALILEWCKQSAAAKRKVRFSNIPLQLQAIARVAGVDAIIHKST
jgi:phospholipid transport system transporter-binding protein